MAKKSDEQRLAELRYACDLVTVETVSGEPGQLLAKNRSGETILKIRCATRSAALVAFGSAYSKAKHAGILPAKEKP